jgi:hypothetical protein
MVLVAERRRRPGRSPIQRAIVGLVANDVSLRDRLSRSVAELDAQRLQDRFAGIDVSSIDAVVPRRPTRFGGEIRSQHRSAADGRPMLRVAVNDGSGTALAVFTGRSRIRGFEVGRAVLFEGVTRRDGDRLIVVNPAYTLLD